ncbi:hypothetical protein BO71DRAFT_397825 [Aspergillus ellipticus CBS 707.79]|uniref:Uncharacterized protein n=1 Tax=Aspergillus ellipticus CBS 707.79 TaxID=1448320 RepID=A0A319EVT6_9EURO|nr:hypothetical protein BO71DRAFT_397825 [Aspergillus ellipticus CBS 707.79]
MTTKEFNLGSAPLLRYSPVTTSPTSKHTKMHQHPHQHHTTPSQCQPPIPRPTPTSAPTYTPHITPPPPHSHRTPTHLIPQPDQRPTIARPPGQTPTRLSSPVPTHLAAQSKTLRLLTTTTLAQPRLDQLRLNPTGATPSRRRLISSAPRDGVACRAGGYSLSRLTWWRMLSDGSGSVMGVWGGVFAVGLDVQGGSRGGGRIGLVEGKSPWIEKGFTAAGWCLEQGNLEIIPVGEAGRRWLRFGVTVSAATTAMSEPRVTFPGGGVQESREQFLVRRRRGGGWRSRLNLEGD